jgi:hypoxanthine phosphoribosyltransferase
VDKNVLIVEDIYDSGHSMDAIRTYYQQKHVKDLKVCILLHKRNLLNIEYNYFPDYIGFCIPNKFVIGYGMDLNEYLRDIHHLCIISSRGIAKYSV